MKKLAVFVILIAICLLLAVLYLVFQLIATSAPTGTGESATLTEAARNFFEYLTAIAPQGTPVP